MREETTEEEFQIFFQEFQREISTNQLAFLVTWFDVILSVGQKIKHANASISEIESLFVKLHGVLSEGADAIVCYFLPDSVIVGLNTELPNAPFSEEYRQLSKSAHENLNMILQAFSKEEKELIEFIRNRSAHLQIAGYLVTINNKTNRLNLNRNGEDKRNLRNRLMSLLATRGGILPFAEDCFSRIESPSKKIRAAAYAQLNRRNQDLPSSHKRIK